MSIVAQNAARTDTWKDLQLNEGDIRQQARNEKGTRLLNILFWIVIGVCIYVATFYVGAFGDVGKMLGISYSDRADRTEQRMEHIAIAREHSIVSPFLGNFSPTKMYLRNGQTVQLGYALPDGAFLTARIKQCDASPLFEVFKCKFVGVTEQHISNAGRGVLNFTVASDGFYYFENEVSLLSGTLLESSYDYQTAWQRS